MAIDTTNKKLSLLSWMQPWQLPLPVSADGLGQADQQQLLWGYAGLAWGGIVQRFRVQVTAVTLAPWVAVTAVAPTPWVGIAAVEIEPA